MLSTPTRQSRRESIRKAQRNRESSPNRELPPTQLSDEAVDNKCACEICSCGTHRCPESSRYPFEGESTTHHDYRPHQVTFSPMARNTKKLQQEPMSTHYDPQDLKTSYSAAYVPHQVQFSRSPSPKSRNEYRPSPFKLEAQTEYKARYVEKPISPLNKTAANNLFRNYKPEYKPSKIKFQAETTYNQHYSPVKNTPSSPGSPSRRRAAPVQRKALPFEGSSTYKDDYSPPKAEGVRPQTTASSPYNPRRHQEYSPSKFAFEGETSYKSDYKPVGLPTTSRRTCIMDRLPRLPNQCSPGKTHLNYSAQKNTWI